MKQIRTTSVGQQDVQPSFSAYLSIARSALLFAVFLTCFYINTFAQAPGKELDADFGGSDGDFLYSLQQTADNGYILGGYSESGISGDKTEPSRGSSDYWAIKTDGKGGKQWDKRYGGTSVDQLFGLQQTTDGGYILGGYSFSGIGGDKTQTNRGQNDYWIVKSDASGAKQWDARFGGSSYEELHALQQTADGGYILGGFSMSGANGDKTQPGNGGQDYWMVKVNASGVKEWDAVFGGAQFDVLNAVKQTADGGYIMGGYSLSGATGNKSQESRGASDFWVVKTNASGVKEWDARFGGSSDDWLTSLQQTTDGGYILGGWSWSGLSGDKTQATKGDNDYWVVKINANGVKEWDADFGGSSNDYANAITQTNDGGYALAGYSSSPISGDKTMAGIGGTDYWMIKMNGSGVKEWDLQFGGTDFDFLYDMKLTADGGYILGGYSSSPASADKTADTKGINDYWIVKTTGSSTACNLPSNTKEISLTATTAELDWDDVENALSYKVRYKISGANEWTTVKASGSGKTLTGLVPATKYLWEVRTICQKQPSINSDWSPKKSFMTPPLRIAAESNIMSVTIYPNPVSSQAVVSFNVPSGSPVEVDVMDVNGRIVAEITKEYASSGLNELTFDVSSFDGGIYFVYVKTIETTVMRKMVKP